MNPKQKLFLMVGAATCGLIIVILAVLLILEGKEMSQQCDSRDEAKDELQRYYDAKPYPNAKNCDVRKADIEAYNAWTEEAQKCLTPPLETPEGESPSQFVDRMATEVRELNKQQKNIHPKIAVKGRETAPEEIQDYSFGRYIIQGEIPSEKNVPRLAHQFAVIDHMCQLLFKNGANRINEVTREMFDVATDQPVEPVKTTRSSRRGRSNARSPEPVATNTGATELAPALVKDGVQCESYSIKFRANYVTLATVLNEIAKDNLFVVITDLSFNSTYDLRNVVADKKKKREVQRSMARQRAAKKGEAEPSAATALFEGATPTERLVTDPEHAAPLEVSMKFDVYTLKPTEKEGK